MRLLFLMLLSTSVYAQSIFYGSYRISSDPNIVLVGRDSANILYVNDKTLTTSLSGSDGNRYSLFFVGTYTSGANFVDSVTVDSVAGGSMKKATLVGRTQYPAGGLQVNIYGMKNLNNGSHTVHAYAPSQMYGGMLAAVHLGNVDQTLPIAEYAGNYNYSVVPTVIASNRHKQWLFDCTVNSGGQGNMGTAGQTLAASISNNADGENCAVGWDSTVGYISTWASLGTASWVLGAVTVNQYMSGDSYDTVLTEVDTQLRDAYCVLNYTSATDNGYLRCGSYLSQAREWGAEMPLAIPKDADIINAVLICTVNDNSGWGVTDTMSVRAFAVDNASAFVHGASEWIHEHHTRGTDSTYWISPDGWAGDRVERSFDASALVQAVVNRSGWSSGNYIGFCGVAKTYVDPNYMGFKDYTSGSGRMKLRVVYH